MHILLRCILLCICIFYFCSLHTSVTVVFVTAKVMCYYMHHQNHFCVFSGWRIAAQVTFAIGYGILFISLCLAIGNLMFGCCKQKVFSKETCPMIFAVLITIASKWWNQVTLLAAKCERDIGSTNASCFALYIHNWTIFSSVIRVTGK